jgi:energy-coupling factor transport system ATP-binding protein
MAHMPQTPRIEFRDFTFAYPGRPRTALEAVSFALAPGEMAVVSGRNGAGKSTLTLAANGTIPFLLKGGRCSGGVFLDGQAMGQPGRMAPQVGVVFQDFESQLVSSTVTLETAFPLENAGWPPARQAERVNQVLAMVGLAGFGERIPGELSGGEKQRLAIAAAMALAPSLLVLDEPLTDLDPAGKAAVLETIGRLRSQGVTILIVEHDPQAILAADTLLVLDGGKLAWKGAPRGMLADPDQCARLGLPLWAPAVVARKAGLPESAVTVDEVASLLSGHPRVASVSSPAPELTTSHLPLITVRNLSSGYPAGPEILHDVSLEIKEGECIALLGQNGSGKTTLAKHLCGLVRPRAGEVVVAGKPVSAYRQAELSRISGYVFQNPDHQIFSATVGEEVAFGLHNLGLSAGETRSRTEESLLAVGLEGRESEDPFSLNRGERQRLAVASLLAYRPRMIIFDEPTTALDAVESLKMVRFIGELNRKGTTVVLVTHAMWVAAEYTSRIVVMGAGRVVMDGPVGWVFAREKELGALALVPPPAAALANRLGISAVSSEGLLGALGLAP